VRARLDTLLRELTTRRAANQEAKEERAETRREILRAQAKQIRKELGDGADDEDNEWVERVRAAKLSADAEAAALREARRLGTLGEGSAEANVARTYLEWLLELPWTRASDDKLDVAAARAVLEADHRGLGKVKKRILEYLSVASSRRRRSADPAVRRPPASARPRSAARSRGAPDESSSASRSAACVTRRRSRPSAHLRRRAAGTHRAGLKRAGTRNPVFMLDEITSCRRFRGDPAAALLEVLDPEQNSTFTDHYMRCRSTCRR